MISRFFLRNIVRVAHQSGMKINGCSCSPCSIISTKHVFAFDFFEKPMFVFNIFSKTVCSCSFVFDIFTKSTRSCSIRVHVRVRYSVMKSGVATDGFQTLLAHLLNIHPNRSPKSKLP